MKYIIKPCTDEDSESETENKNTISVMIPKENYLNPDTLLKLLQKMAEEV